VLGEPITYDARKKLLSAVGEAPLPLAEDGRLRLRVLVDRTSIETFANGGRISLTGCFLAKEGQPAVAFRSTGGVARAKSLVVYELKSSW
jgi:fructan beta-fructosidase